MRKTTWVLLVLFVFSIPWEYSLDIGAPFGNVARILGLLTMLMAVPAVLEAGCIRTFGSVHWLALALYSWFCCGFFWTATPTETLTHLRGYAQEMILIWLVWEFVESLEGLRVLLRAWLAGSWILVILTIASFVITRGHAPGQVRFVAIGQDPNDVARFIVFGFPVAAGLLFGSSSGWAARVLWLLYFPVGFAAVLVTASRSGLLIAAVALCGCGAAALRKYTVGVIVAVVLVCSAMLLVFYTAPAGTFERLGTMAELWESRDLNQRANIWSAGWRAFEAVPLIGHGAGSFATAAELGSADTAHNTALGILVEAGLCGLLLAMGIVVVTARAIWKTRGQLRFALAMLMLVWSISSLIGTEWENRLTWLLFGIAAVAPTLRENVWAEPERNTDGSSWESAIAGLETGGSG